MCQLVLGAGAMQTSGLKSITAKHLAISCQSVGIMMELQPILADILYQNLPASRKGLLSSELNLLRKVSLPENLNRIQDIHFSDPVQRSITQDGKKVPLTQ